MIFLLLKLPAYHEKQNPSSQRAFPGQEHPEQTPGNHIRQRAAPAIPETQTGSKAKNKLQTKHRTPAHCYQPGTPSASPDSSPLSQEYFKATFNLPTPLESRDQSPALGMDTLSCPSPARLPQTPPQPFEPPWWYLPSCKSHFCTPKLFLRGDVNVKALSAPERCGQGRGAPLAGVWA